MTNVYQKQHMFEGV